MRHQLEICRMAERNCRRCGNKTLKQTCGICELGKKLAFVDAKAFNELVEEGKCRGCYQNSEATPESMKVFTTCKRFMRLKCNLLVLKYKYSVELIKQMG